MMIYLIGFTPFKRKGLLSRLFSSGMDFSCRRISGVDFCTVTVVEGSQNDWRRILQATGGGSVILPKGIKPPDSVRLSRYDTHPIKRQLLSEGAVRVTELALLKGAHLSVLLLDKRAEYVHLLEPLLKASGTVTVVTNEQAYYNEVASELVNRCGASPIITDDTQNVRQCDLIIAPDGISGCGALPLPSMIFAPTGYDCITVTSDSIDRGEFDFEGYDMLEILTALRSECSYKPRLRSMSVKGQEVSLEHLALQLAVKCSC